MPFDKIMKIIVKPYTLGLLLLITGCELNPEGSNQHVSPRNSSSSSSSSSQSHSSVSNPTNLVLNHFGTQIIGNHFQVIVSSWLSNGSTYFATNSLLDKEDISILFACEQTPVIFNGKYYEVVSVHPAVGGQENNINTYIVVMNVDGVNNIVARTGTFTSMCCAIVNGGTLYIYGTLLSRNGITRDCQIPWVFYTQDLINFQSNQVFSTDPTNTIFNTSVCFDGTRYVMALEAGYFNPVFAQSADGKNFTLMNLKYQNGSYNACPTIRYSNGYYYMIYLIYTNGLYNEMITRTADFVNWQDSVKNPVLVPDSFDMKDPSCIDTSDIDMVEYGGQLHVYYCIGNQSSWFNIRRAYYNGTMANFFNWFYM